MLGAGLDIAYDARLDVVQLRDVPLAQQGGRKRSRRDAGPAPSSPHGTHAISLLCEEEWPLVEAVARKEGADVAKLRNLFTYLSSVIRCVIYVVVRDGSVRVFAPLCARHFRNTFSHRISDADAAVVERACGTPRDSWYMNGKLLCERPSRDTWGDYLFLELKYMVQQAARRLPEHVTYEFCVNKRDHAMVHASRVADPYTGSPLPAMVARAASNLPTFLSFYSSSQHADNLMPLPHDAFSESTSPIPWQEKRDVAFFRGGATGLGLRQWLVSAARTLRDLYAGEKYAVDAGLTSVPRRWRWRLGDGGRIELLPPQTDRPPLTAPVPEREWGRYKVLLYCDGNAGATRWLKMFSHGSLVVRLRDESCPCPDMWASQNVLKKGVHYMEAEARMESLDACLQSAFYDEATSRILASEGLCMYELMSKEIESGEALARVISETNVSQTALRTPARRVDTRASASQ